MCNITVKGRACKIQPHKEYCHMHLKQILDKHKSSEIKNLNRTIEKQSNKIKDLQSQQDKIMIDLIALQLENKRVSQELEDATFRSSELEYNFNSLQSEFKAIYSDFQSYQIIKNFEYIRYRLSKICDTSELSKIELFMMQKNNYEDLENILGVKENFYDHFTTLRLQRNRLSHWWGR